MNLSKSCLMRTRHLMKSNWRQSPLLALAGWARQPSPKQFMTRSKPGLIVCPLSPLGKILIWTKVLKNILYVLDKQKFEDIHDTTGDEKLLIDQLSEFLIDKRYIHEVLAFYFISKKENQIASKCLLFISSFMILLVDHFLFFNPFFAFFYFLS